MTIFVDTSALIAALSVRDARHHAVVQAWREFLAGDDSLLTSNYVLVVTMALLGRRIGVEAVRLFQTEIVPALEIVWVDHLLHERAVAALLTAGLRDLSLVDCVSFEVMRQQGVDTAFALDAHFNQQGFHRMPD